MVDFTNFIVSIIIPVFNEEQTISSVIKRTKRLQLPCETEILVVNDCSTDRTLPRIERFSGVKLVSHHRNRGKGASIRTALKISKGNIIVIQDADLEYLPEMIPSLISPILKGEAEIVFGSRFYKWPKGMSFLHFIGNLGLSVSTSLMFLQRITDMMTGHKAFLKCTLEKIDICSDRFDFEAEITAKLLKHGYRIVEIGVPYTYRKEGSSKIGILDGFQSFFRLCKVKLDRNRPRKMDVEED